MPITKQRFKDLMVYGELYDDHCCYCYYCYYYCYCCYYCRVLKHELFLKYESLTDNLLYPVKKSIKDYRVFDSKVLEGVPFSF